MGDLIRAYVLYAVDTRSYFTIEVVVSNLKRILKFGQTDHLTRNLRLYTVHPVFSL